MTTILEKKRKEFSVQRSPTLTTVLMVEETLQNTDGVLTIAQLRSALPKKVMHQTLIRILEYLEKSGKITYHDGQILWTFKPIKLRGLRVR